MIRADTMMGSHLWRSHGISIEWPQPFSGFRPNTEQRTTNFHGAARNLRLDFETIFFSDPKLFELENFSPTTLRGWGIGRVTFQFVVRCSVFGHSWPKSWDARKVSPDV